MNTATSLSLSSSAIVTEIQSSTPSSSASLLNSPWSLSSSREQALSPPSTSSQELLSDTGVLPRKAVYSVKRGRRVVGACQRFLVKLHSDTAKLPVRSTTFSAGLDLYCSSNIVLPPYRTVVGFQPTRIPLDISLAIPRNCYGRITGRSSMGMRGILVLDGVIDSDYRGRVDVMAVNLTAEPVSLMAGERIAQMILEQIHLARPQLVKADDELTTTERGSGGFGSSGR